MQEHLVPLAILVVVASLLCAAARRTPGRWLEWVAVIIALIDLVTGGNYMYLRRVPAGGSLLSLMGPWPWYIVVGAAVALFVLAVLDAPFRLWSRGQRRLR